MSKDSVLQVLMAFGFLVGIIGIVRHVIYNLSLFGLKKPANHMAIQFSLYGLFAAIFLVCIILQKMDL
jgi:hypothetical protein